MCERDKLKNALSEIIVLNDLISERDNRIRDLENKITNREIVIDELRKKLKDKEDLIDSLEKGTEEKNKRMKEMRDTIERLDEWKVDLTRTNHDLVEILNKREAELKEKDAQLECFRLNFDPDLEAYKKENLALKEELDHIKNRRVCVAPPCLEDAIEELHHKLSNSPRIRWHIEYDVDEQTYYIEIKKVYN